MFIPQDSVSKPLVVITTVFNPIRYKTRWKLYQRFARMVKDAGAVLITIEAAFGERQHAVEHAAPTGAVDSLETCGLPGQADTYIRVRCKDELWLKENLGNLALQHVPEGCDYIAWMDADVEPVRSNWVGETIHQLQHYAAVQMFTQAQDLGPNHEVLKLHRSFADCYRADLPFPIGITTSGSDSVIGARGVNIWHPGFAWAFRREALDMLGGFLDCAILGSADRHMANALVGRVEDSIPAGIHPRYRENMLEWQSRAERYVRRNIGVVDGLLLHYWHGRKADRGYKTRWQILVEHLFNPDTDIRRNLQGVYQWCDHGDVRSAALRDDVRRYFRSRNEDTIEVR